MIELVILHAFCKDKQAYLRYSRGLPLSYIKTNFKEIHKLFSILNLIYTKQSNTSISAEDLMIAYLGAYPVIKDGDRAELERLIRSIFTTPIPESLPDLLSLYNKRAGAGELAILALSVNEGKTPPTKLLEACRAFADDKNEPVHVEFVPDDLETLYSKTVGGPGIHWPLTCLNESLGPLRKGNMGFLFARPEGGKTTFMAHFATHAATQVEKPIIWFNNEQPGEEVKIRLYQAAFGITTQELFKERVKYQALYKEKTKSLIFLLDDAIIDRVKIESITEQHQPSLIIFDQIDKIQGFSDDRYDLELGQRYQWARELAKAYCPVIGVTQADASGENQKYLTMGNVANAKTAKQAEADWILGIGSSQHDDFQFYRYFSISKNKLLGDANTKAELRHGRFQILLEPEIARFREL